MSTRFMLIVLVALAGALVAGCANDALLGNNGITTASVVPPPPKPECVALDSQIGTLRKDGVADKIEKAAAKKYKMTPADLAKADQLTKVNAEFQAKCSTLPVKAVVASPTPVTTGTPAVKTSAVPTVKPLTPPPSLSQ